MTREIKFRAWDGKKIIGCDLLIQWNGQVKWCDLDGADAPYPNDKYTLLQYTGLKDKNGKEIYEGDIVVWTQSCDGAMSKQGPEEVKWSNGGFEVFNIDHGGMLYHYEDFDYEVIGNIYENGDLLEKEQ